MAFTGNDIIDDAEFYIEVTLSDANAQSVINRGLNRLGTIGVAYGTTEVSVGSETADDVAVDTYFTLTDDVIGVLFVTDENDNQFERWDFQKDGGNIKFAEEGTYEVNYKQMPANITDLISDISLHDIYKTPLTKHYEGLVKLKYNDTSPDGTRLMQEFERLATRGFNVLIQSNIPADIRASEFMSGMIASGQGRQE